MADQSSLVRAIRPGGRLADGGLARLWAFPPGAAWVVGLLLALCWLATYVGGGAGKVPPHFFYVPIMVAASRFGFLGAAVTALVSGILAGPLMPLDVRTDAPQAVLDWGSRTGFFLGIGLLMAGVISRRNRAERDRAAREAELETLRAIDLSILGVAPFEETVAIAREALGRLIRVDRLGLIILDGDRARIHRYWVSRGGETQEADQNLPAEGPLARALRTGEVASGIVDPAGSDWERELAAEGLRSYLVVPLVAAREVVGALAASSRRGAPFPREEVDTAGRVAAQLAVALRAGNLAAQIERRASDLEAVRVVSEAVGASLDLDQVLEAALDLSLEVTGLDMGSVSLVDEESGELLLVAERNTLEALRRVAPRLPVSDSVLSQVVAEGRPRIIPEVTLQPPFQSREALGASGHRTVTLVAAPLEWEGRGVGVLALGSLEGRLSDADDLALVAALARPIAAAAGNARLYGSLRQLEEQRRELLARLLRAEEEERRRIAADIHDDPIQTITAAGMRLDLLRRALVDPEHLALVEKARRAVEGAVARLRSMLFQLHPPALDREGLAPPLQALLDELEEEAGVQAHLEVRVPAQPPAHLRAVLYRIAQEALANVRKHAHATSVSVLLEGRDGGFCIRVEDNGAGFTLWGARRGLPGHLGLPGMRERAELAGGWCRVDSLPEAGTTVEAWVPAEPESVEA